MSLLDVRHLTAGYGEGAVLHQLSIQIEAGTIAALIGVNGAGKTTLMRVISGMIRPASGEIIFDGQPISTRRPEDIVALGLAHVPEGRRLFPAMSVFENLLVGSSSTRAAKRVHESLDFVLQLFPKLKERRRQAAGTLSGGEQQMVAIGRALMTDPVLLLLDETSLGLAPVVVEDIFAAVSTLNQRGLTILVVEQNTALALKVASYAYVLEHGSVLLHGPASKLAGDDRIRRAYLGL